MKRNYLVNSLSSPPHILMAFFETLITRFARIFVKRIICSGYICRKSVSRIIHDQPPVKMRRSRKRCSSKKKLEIGRMSDFASQRHRLPVITIINGRHLLNFSLYNMDRRIEAYQSGKRRPLSSDKFKNFIYKSEI